MERIASLLLPRPRTSSAPLFGALALVGLLLAGGLSLRAQGLRETVPPTSEAMTNANSKTSVLLVKVSTPMGQGGKPIPYARSLDVHLESMPWQQIRPALQKLLAAEEPILETQVVLRCDDRVPGPRVSLDVKAATPNQVRVKLNELTRAMGAQEGDLLKVGDVSLLTLRKRMGTSGQPTFSLEAKQVSLEMLDQLFLQAQRLATSKVDAEVACEREDDLFAGPRVDVQLRGLTLAELEVRVGQLKRDSKS